MRKSGRFKSAKSRTKRRRDKIEREFKDHSHDYMKLHQAAMWARWQRHKHGVGRPPKVNLERIWSSYFDSTNEDVSRVLMFGKPPL